MTLLLLVGRALAWPATSDWEAVELAGSPLSDPCADISGNEWWDIVGTSTDAAAYWYEDSTDVYFRLRLHDDPTSSGAWRSFGWGVAFETDWELTSYEYMVFVDGKTDSVTLYENTSESTPITSASAETDLVSYSSLTTATYSAVGSTVCTSGSDYFVDWSIPLTDLSAYTGLSSITEAGLVFGTSANSATFQKDVAGWDGAAGTPTLDDVLSDTDWDDDGLDAEEEAAVGTDPGDADSDEDGLGDGDEVDVYGTDATLSDTDGDGVLDGTELGLTDADLDADTDTSAGGFVADADPSTTTDPTMADSDGGGADDGTEDADGDGAIGAGETDPLDPSDDFPWLDADGDGIDNDTEGWSAGEDTDGDGTPDYLDADSDDDGLLDLDEGTLDADADGLGNWRDPDSDADGYSDADETTEGTDPYDPSSFPGSVDTGSIDTGSIDTGSIDTGGVDTGGVETGILDTSGVDTGAGDTSVIDTGGVDTSTVDTGTVDTSDPVDTAPHEGGEPNVDGETGYYGGGCGCSDTGSPGAAGAVALGVAALLVRRRTTH